MKPAPIIATLLALTLTATLTHAEPNWPNWRGPNGDGIVPEGNPPLTWSDTENIKWKIPMPGESDSTPIVWGDKMFIQYAIATAEEPKTDRKAARGSMGGTVPTVPWDFNLRCIDRHTGETLWDQTATTAIPHQGHHPHTSFSAFSPLTDGERVWASFGSQGLFCFDLDGNLQWQKELIELDIANSFGESSSPVLAGNAVVVIADHEGQSKIFAFNKNDGQLLWEKNRDEGTTWASPLALEFNGKTQIITSGTNSVRSYDLETGDIIWQASGLKDGVIPTPVAGNGLVYCATGYIDYAMMAIRLGGKGELNTSDSIAWQLDHATPYVNSPLLYDGIIYTIESVKPMISAFRAENGEVLFEREKIAGMKPVYSSPIGVAGRIYMADRKGNTVVLKAGEKFDVLAMNTLDDEFDASPVVIGDTLYLKGTKNLYCIEETK